MESTVSVSKGVFVFPNEFKKQKNLKKKNKSLFEKIFTTELWYETYKRHKNYLENQIANLHHKTYSVLLSDIVHYIKSFHKENNFISMEGIIPSATLLTGVNQPDHVSEFKALIDKIRDEVTPHIAMVSSQDAATLKHLVENVVWQLIYGVEALDDSIGETDCAPNKRLKKNQCTMKALRNWYNSSYCVQSTKKRKLEVSKRSLVVIIPDFESFNCTVLQDFVMIVSSYTSLPIVLVFGVATSVSALHKSFPYNVSSKLLIKVFHSHSSPVYMNRVLEEIFLTHSSPFHLSGKAFELLTDVFLFYDFSVTGLIHSTMYCMMEHFYGDNSKALCCERDKIEEVLQKLTADDLENVRQLMSFRPFVESSNYETQIKLFENDNFFREVLYEELNKLHDYVYTFYVCIILLLEFVKDLPKNVLGKSVREIYTKCTIEDITSTESFKESMQLINFQSQVQLAETIKNGLKIVNGTLQIMSPVKPFRATPTKNNLDNINLSGELGEVFVKSIRVHLLVFLRQIEKASTKATVLTRKSVCEDAEKDQENILGNRNKFKEKLLQSAKSDRIQSEFEMIRSRFVSYLEEMFTKGLKPPHTRPFHEIFFFSEVASVKKQIVGAPRGALHVALSNPVHYLQCCCCHLPTSESMLPCLPDVCLVYKLHRECGKHINLYDWLQAFAAVLRPDEEDEQRHQDPSIQLRFTRAVAELQFLGFIKSSKRKTDHVMRLTW